jgi:thymidylate synthase (FAD)
MKYGVTAMKVELVSFSQDTQRRSLIGQIAYAARVSNPANQNNFETAEKLVRYLIKNQHWSPLEMVSICLEIETTRDIARQILRHRSFSFQEFSQRYAVADIGFELREARMQDMKNRQNSIEIDFEDDKNRQLAYQWEVLQNSIIEKVNNAYGWALDHGIAKEQARAILPEGMTVSRMYMNGTLRSWVHYIQLRTEKGTQKEHREVALECANVIENIFPMIKEFVSV